MRRNRLAVAALSGVLLAACTTAPPAADDVAETATPNGPAARSAGPSPTPGTTGSAATQPPPAEPEAVATDLDVPWGLALLPDGGALLTLRDRAEVLRIRRGEEPVSLGRVPDVAPTGEGGLLGIAVSPSDPDVVFVYLSAARENRVLRMRVEGDRLVPDRVVLDGIPRSSNHNGGRLAFGPDGYLYVTTGDGGTPATSQDPGSLAGKILRVDADGAPAPGNPFAGSPVWSLGHRNVQGIDWDAEGRMFASELGENTWDELNRIEPGSNYGWPLAEGAAGIEGVTDPLHQWRPAQASPSGLAVTDDAIYVAGLRGQSLWQVPVADDGSTGEPVRLLHNAYGRLRTVVEDPDGMMWLVTSNTFRGAPRAGDDRVLRIDPRWLAATP